MKLCLIADTFPPMRTSGAVQLRDLSREFERQGHSLTVILPSPEISTPWALETMGTVRILRLWSPKTKDINYVRRTLAELWMPFAMLRGLRKSPLSGERWDGVVWYAPSIFLGPIVSAIKRASGCRAYLIIRDIFPDWAVDMGLMRRGLVYRFFKAVAEYQYSIANTIGVQCDGNLERFSAWSSSPGRHLQVLHNWLEDVDHAGCSISISDTPIAGRKIFVYAGNMGVAQGLDILLALAERVRDRADVGFLFVGRGTAARQLAADAKKRNLDNVVFKDEISSEEIPGLYAQCHVGLIALDPRHTTHNIPGKFLTYMQSGLPVLASINPGNDLAEMIGAEDIGAVTVDNSVESLERLALDLLDKLDADTQVRARCRSLFAKMFQPETAVRQIVVALTPPQETEHLASPSDMVSTQLATSEMSPAR